MTLNVGKEISKLSRLSPAQLRDRYADLTGEATRSGNRQFLTKRILWRLQANAEGDLSQRAFRRATELAQDSDVRLNPPRVIPGSDAAVSAKHHIDIHRDKRLPPPGNVITRDYKGHRVLVTVLPSGFEYEGEHYRSLSAVAKEVTCSHVNGFQFFRLGGQA